MSSLELIAVGLIVTLAAVFCSDVLEETPPKGIQQLRWELRLHSKKHLQIAFQMNHSFQNIRLYGILDLGYVSAADCEKATRSMLDGGVQILQLRAKMFRRICFPSPSDRSDVQSA